MRYRGHGVHVQTSLKTRTGKVCGYRCYSMAHLHMQALVQACDLHGRRLGARRRQVHHVASALSVGREAKLLLPDLDRLAAPCSLRTKLLLHKNATD